MTPLYYPVWIAANRKDSPISWGKPCDSPGEAAAVLKERIAAGHASFGVVVRFADGEREAMETYIWPTSARRIIRHYLDVLDSLDGGPT